MPDTRQLQTRKGAIAFPAYIPVTTFGRKYPLDDLVRPYLPRLAPAVMVSHYYAKQQDRRLRIPMLVDSGGFVSLFEKARILKVDGLGIIELETENGTEHIRPTEVLDFQEEVADVAFTLDFPIPPGMGLTESRKRLNLTVTNALWALQNRRRRDLPLYACVQGWDAKSYAKCAMAYVDAGFNGIAVGGLIPRMRDEALILEITTAIRKIHPDLPLHIFGLGQPGLVSKLYEAGVDSVDSSAYVKLAADGRGWGSSKKVIANATAIQRLHLALTNLANACESALPLSAGIRCSTRSLEA